MSYNILGINPFHNGSACVLADGEVVYFLEEERLSKLKHDSDPFRVILEILKKFKIDEVVVAGINLQNSFLSYRGECPFASLIRKFYPHLPITNVSNTHHLTHLSHTYYNSGFKETLGIVIDAGGSSYEGKGVEIDSIYVCSPLDIKLITQNFSHYSNNNQTVGLNAASSYDCINLHLGFKKNEEGKTMGLSSYGQNNNLFPPFFIKNSLSNTQFLYEYLEYNSELNVNRVKRKFTLTPPNTKTTFTQEEKDLAWKIQNDTQQLVGDLIEKHLKETGLNHVCCAGGYFLNCVANYYFTKRFPNIRFYFEPVSSDAGTSIGAAKMLWYQKVKYSKPNPQKTLYYGPKYSKEELLEGIKKYT